MGFANDSKGYVALKTDTPLDATTIKKENFKISAAGDYSSAVGDVRYFPMTNEVRVYLKNVPDYTFSPKYDITATGIKDINGKEVSLNDSVYLTTFEDCDLFDVSVLNLTFTLDGQTYYKQPQEGSYKLNLSVVNTTGKTENVEIIVYAKNEAGNIREICKDEATINPDSIFRNSYSVNILSGETICVSADKH